MILINIALLYFSLMIRKSSSDFGKGGTSLWICEVKTVDSHGEKEGWKLWSFLLDALEINVEVTNCVLRREKCDQFQ